MGFEIKPLSKELKEDYLYFFDNIVFDENPDRSKCYCCDYHFLGDVETCTREISRPFVANMIDEQNFSGYLVFDGDKAVGWCNVNDRSNYQRLLRDYDVVDNPADKACSIVCFLIHPDYRRRGIAQQLLKRIIQDKSTGDFNYLEAYPRKSALTSEDHFKGPMELYQRFGFETHKEHENFYAVRKNLN